MQRNACICTLSLSSVYQAKSQEVVTSRYVTWTSSLPPTPLARYRCEVCHHGRLVGHWPAWFPSIDGLQPVPTVIRTLIDTTSAFRRPSAVDTHLIIADGRFLWYVTLSTFICARVSRTKGICLRRSKWRCYLRGDGICPYVLDFDKRFEDWNYYECMWVIWGLGV